MSKLIPLCFPVWNYADYADPYMASIRRIHKICVNDPDREAVLIGSVFDQAHNEMLARSPAPEREVVNA